MRANLSWDAIFLDIATTVAERSKDDSTQAGAVLVDHRHVVISTGFNGPPPQLDDELIPWNVRPNVSEFDKINEPHKYAFIIHSEENAILFGMEARGSIAGSTMYSTHTPCSECMLRIVRAGVRELVMPKCRKPYPLAKYQVDPMQIIARQKFRKLEIREV